MAEIKYELDPGQGFNFSKDVQLAVGFVKSLNIGGTDIPADLNVQKPHETSKNKVVGVMKSVGWSPGSAPGDPIELTFLVSTKNKMNLAMLVHEKLQSIEVKISWIVVDYDPVRKDYFPAYYDDEKLNESKPLSALIFREGKDLKLSVGAKAATEVQAPENWEIVLKIAPQPKAQHFIFAVGFDPKGGTALNKVTKVWGVTVE